MLHVSQDTADESVFVKSVIKTHRRCLGLCTSCQVRIDYRLICMWQRVPRPSCPKFVSPAPWCMHCSYPFVLAHQGVAACTHVLLKQLSVALPARMPASICRGC